MQLDIELVDGWECTWPRPVQREGVERAKLWLRRGGVLDFRSWFDLCFRDSAPGGVVGPLKQRLWFANVHPHLDANRCMHLSDIPGAKSEMDLFASLWRQVLYGAAKQVEAHGSCKL